MQFREFFEKEKKISELFVKGHQTPLEGHHVIAYRQFVWILNQENFDKYAEQIGNVLGIDVPDDIYDLETEIREQHPDVIIGQIQNGKLFMNVDNWRHGFESPVMRKLLRQLELNGVDISYFSSAKNDSVELSFGAKHFQQVKNATFYHGTTYEGLKGIMRVGLKPSGHETNFKEIKHYDKVFVTTNIDKAEFHAFNAAQKKENFPIIIGLKIPDPNKLVFDYDFAMRVMGQEHGTTQQLGYKHPTGDNYQFSPQLAKRNKDRLEGLARNLGVFGYMGRIPPKFITEIHYDDENFPRFYIDKEQLGYNEIELDQLEPAGRWHEESPEEFRQTVINIDKEYEDQMSDEEEDEI